jgi:hypothetical protein
MKIPKAIITTNDNFIKELLLTYHQYPHKQAAQRKAIQVINHIALQ